MTDAKVEIVTGQDPAKTTIKIEDPPKLWTPAEDHIGKITIHLTQDPDGTLTKIDYSAEWINSKGEIGKHPITGTLEGRLPGDTVFNLGMEIAKIREILAREIPPF